MSVCRAHCGFCRGICPLSTIGSDEILSVFEKHCDGSKECHDAICEIYHSKVLNKVIGNKKKFITRFGLTKKEASLLMSDDWTYNRELKLWDKKEIKRISSRASHGRLPR